VRLIFPHLSPLCNPQPVYELSLIGVEVEGQQAPEREELVMSCLEPRNLERAHVGDSGPRHIDETLPISSCVQHSVRGAQLCCGDQQIHVARGMQAPLSIKPRVQLGALANHDVHTLGYKVPQRLQERDPLSPPDLVVQALCRRIVPRCQKQQAVNSPLAKPFEAGASAL